MSEILKPEEDLIMDKDDVVEREEELDEDNEDLEREEDGQVISINQKNNNHVTKTVKIVNYDVEEEEAVVEHGKGCSHPTVCLCIHLRCLDVLVAGCYESGEEREEQQDGDQEHAAAHGVRHPDRPHQYLHPLHPDSGAHDTAICPQVPASH